MKAALLDLHEVELYGWERLKSRKLIDCIRVGVERGDRFDPLYVWKVSEVEYCLDVRRVNQENIDELDGGHHRAYAHWLAHRPLPVLVTEEIPKQELLAYLEHDYFPITDILMAEDHLDHPDLSELFWRTIEARLSQYSWEYRL